MRSTKLKLLVVLPLVAMSAACGGNDSTGLSTSQYGNELDDICRTADRAIGKLDEPTTLDDLSVFADDASQIVQDAVSDMKKLPLPADKSYASDAQDLIANLEDQIDLVDDISKAAGAGDAPEVDTKSERLVKAAEDGAGLADNLDAKRCALAPLAPASEAAAPIDTVPSRPFRSTPCRRSHCRRPPLRQTPCPSTRRRWDPAMPTRPSRPWFPSSPPPGGTPSRTSTRRC